MNEGPQDPFAAVPRLLSRWPRWRRYSVSFKLWLTLLAVALAAELALLFGLLDRVARCPGGLTAGPLALALWLLLPALISSWLGAALVTTVTRLRTRGLERHLRRIAAGELTARLPPPPSPDFAAIHEAFESMGQALALAMERLRAADQQRRRLFADLAHELATPCTTIVGLADTLTRGDLLSGPGGAALQARLLQTLGDEALRLGGLIHDLSDLAHLEDPQVALQRQPTDLGALVRRAVERAADVEAQEAAGRGAAAITLRCSALELVRAVDPARVEQVLVNLLSNARRHTPPGGTIEVRLAQEADAAVLTVQDSGPGVPAELLPRLGERLLRADAARERRHGGHGLGLSIVREIIRRHGGALRFENRAGLLVTVHLP